MKSHNKVPYKRRLAEKISKRGCKLVARYEDLVNLMLEGDDDPPMEKGEEEILRKFLSGDPEVMAVAQVEFADFIEKEYSVEDLQKFNRVVALVRLLPAPLVTKIIKTVLTLPGCQE